MKKIVTLSFDDGEIQDIRLAELLRKYGLQATFYLCSAHIGLKAVLPSGRRVEKVEAKDIRRTYEGFEIGSHGANHDGFVGLSEENLRRVILRDIDIYSAYSDRPVVCSAYPGGQTDAETISKLHRLRVVKFARGVPDGKISFNRFEEEMDILPQAHMFDKDVYDIIDAFENTKNDDINILHIYGHSYEADLYENGWENIEMLLRRLSGTDAEKLCNGEAYAAAFRRKYVCPE